MSTELQIQQQTTALDWECNDQLKIIKDIYGKDATSLEFNTFVNLGKATGLNPFLREIWLVKYGNTAASIFIARDGYRKSAQAHPSYDYHMADAVYSNDTFKVINGEPQHEYNIKDRGILLGAYAVAKRKGSSKPTFVYVDLKEYNKGQSVWKDKPATMIKKVAEAQCLRMTFQELFAGTYHEDEDDFTKTKAELSSKPKGVSGLKERLGITQQEPVDAEYTTTDTHEETQSNNQPDIETIKAMLEQAETVTQLVHVADALRTMILTENDRAELKELYKKRSKELANINNTGS